MEEEGFFSSIFSPIESLLSMALETLYSVTDSLGFGSYGLAIILLTIIIKLALYPLTQKQLTSMKAMQEIQPKLKKLQDKYKDDPQMLQQKMMELYQKSGVNPLAGCLPLLIQMPILMAMYYALFNFDYGGAPPSDPFYILPLLSALTTFLQQKISSTAEVTQQMRMMMIIMPVFIGFISLNFPAGLVLYWVTMNVVQILMQLLMLRKDSGEKQTA